MIENNKDCCKTLLIHSIVMDITIARVAETNLHIQNFICSKESFKCLQLSFGTLIFFRMDSSNPGVVYVRKYATYLETSINVLNSKDHRFQELYPQLPEVIPMKGLDAQRQWYLFEEVAPFCSNTEVCPKPSCLKPVIKVDTQGASSLSNDSKKRKCSHCKKTGSLQD